MHTCVAAGAGTNASLAAVATNATLLCEGGCPAPMLSETGISDDLAAISAGVGRALAGLDETLLRLDETLRAAQALQGGTAAVLASLAAMRASLECGWLKPAYLAPLQPLLQAHAAA